MPRLRFLQAFKVLVESGALVKNAKDTVIHCQVCPQSFVWRAGNVADANSARRHAAAHVLHNHRRVYDSAVAVVTAEAAGASR